MSLIRSNLPQPTGPMGTSARMIVLPPDFARVLRYYEAGAPERLPAPASWPAPNPLTFVTRAMKPASAPGRAAVANVRLLDVDGDGRLEVLATDMRFGLVMIGHPAGPSATLDVLAQLANPSHISMVDFDRDGRKDFFVADLGDYRPSDRTKGAVVLLRGAPGGKYLTLELYRRASAFCLPCRILDNGDRDGIPNVLAEAMAAGTPVVTTPISGIPEIVRDGENGLLVAPDDPTAVADAVVRLREDRALARRSPSRRARRSRASSTASASPARCRRCSAR